MYTRGRCEKWAPLEVEKSMTNLLRSNVHGDCPREVLCFVSKGARLRLREQTCGCLCTLLYLKWVTRRDLRRSTWNSTPCYMAAWMGGELGVNRYSYQHDWVPLVFTWNDHIVTWLYPNPKLKVKKQNKANNNIKSCTELFYSQQNSLRAWSVTSTCNIKWNLE